MISAFGVEHEISKNLVSDRQINRDLKRREKFAQKYPKGGMGQQVRAKDLKRIQDPMNQTRKTRVKAVKRDLKKQGQHHAVAVVVDRNDPNRTHLHNGHHRVNAQAGIIRNPKMKANIYNANEHDYNVWWLGRPGEEKFETLKKTANKPMNVLIGAKGTKMRAFTDVHRSVGKEGRRQLFNRTAARTAGIWDKQVSRGKLVPTTAKPKAKRNSRPV